MPDNPTISNRSVRLSGSRPVAVPVDPVRFQGMSAEQMFIDDVVTNFVHDEFHNIINPPDMQAQPLANQPVSIDVGQAPAFWTASSMNYRLPPDAVPQPEVPRWEGLRVSELEDAYTYHMAGTHTNHATDLGIFSTSQMAGFYEQYLLDSGKQPPPAKVMTWEEQLDKFYQIIVVNRNFNLTSRYNNKQDKQLVIDTIEELISRNDQLQLMLNQLRITTKEPFKPSEHS